MTKLSSLQQILADPTTEWVEQYKKDAEDTESASEVKEYGGLNLTPIQAHIREREVRGFSRFDWWNFNSYLLWIVAKVAQEVAQGTISSSDDVRKEAQATLDHLIKGAEHNQQGDAVMDALYPDDDELTVDEVIVSALSEKSSPEIWKVIQEHEMEEYNEQQKAVSIFFSKVLPYLPSSEDKYYAVPLGSSENRAQDGYTKEDLTVIRSYLSSIVVSGLQQFAGPLAMGFYGNSLEEWQGKLNKMIKAFQLLLVDEDYTKLENPDSGKEWQVKSANEYKEGINLFIENFAALWD